MHERTFLVSCQRCTNTHTHSQALIQPANIHTHTHIHRDLRLLALYKANILIISSNAAEVPQCCRNCRVAAVCLQLATLTRKLCARICVRRNLGCEHNRKKYKNVFFLFSHFTFHSSLCCTDFRLCFIFSFAPRSI